MLGTGGQEVHVGNGWIRVACWERVDEGCMLGTD